MKLHLLEIFSLNILRNLVLYTKNISLNKLRIINIFK